MPSQGLAATGCSGTDDPDRADEEPAAEDDGTDATSDAAVAGEDEAAADVPAFEPSDPGSWTYLVSSLADTDLEEHLLEDVVEMTQVGSSDMLDVVALVDRAVGYTDTEVLTLPDWETAKLLHVLPGELAELEDLGEIDMGDPAQLAAFIEYQLPRRQLRADHQRPRRWLDRHRARRQQRRGA